MNILGISGLEPSVPFKRTQWPGLDEREYRISQGHDAAAALVIDGDVVAAGAEERFNRRKHSGDFPVGAIRYCLDEAGLSFEDIDEVAHGFDYTPYAKLFSMDEVSAKRYHQVFSRKVLVDRVQKALPGIRDDQVFQVPHHLAHAASAYFTSGWNECLALVADGMGEVESVTAYHCRNGEFELLHSISARDSIGILYSLVTLHLGFDFNADEYKIMGLAPYGDPERFAPFFRKEVELLVGGSVRIPALHLNRTTDERENYTATRRHLHEALIRERHPDDEITQDHRDVAAALQACLDETMLHIAGGFAKRTGIRKLALAGGVALNCTTNGHLLQSGRFDDIYVQPASGDDGTALGAALYRASRNGEVCNRRMPVPFYGPKHSQAEVDRVLEDFADRVCVTRFDSVEAVCKRAAEMIADGRVVAWHRGRMEFGPRALGNRSILADPGAPDMRDRINAMVKKREAFRPFAPSVTVEQVGRFFEVPDGKELPYMIMTVDVRPEFREALPAITHVNGSARVQTVNVKDNPDYHALLKEVGKLTGREMVLNTSFNVKGQPMVNTPSEAVETFLGTGIDALFLERCLVTKADPAHE